MGIFLINIFLIVNSLVIFSIFPFLYFAKKYPPPPAPNIFIRSKFFFRYKIDSFTPKVLSKIDAIFFDEIFEIVNDEISSSEGLKILNESNAVFLDVRTYNEHKLRSIPNSSSKIARKC